LYLLHLTSKPALPGRQLFLSHWFRQLLLCTCFLLSCSVPNLSSAANLQLSSSTTKATAGNFQLSWAWPQAPADTNYQLYERTLKPVENATDFSMLYEGKDMASVLSGKPNGTYQYRINASSESLNHEIQSNMVTVVVKHHSLAEAFFVFSIGVLIFLAILIVIFRGMRQTAE
jgi:hypothetical protein